MGYIAFSLLLICNATESLASFGLGSKLHHTSGAVYRLSKRNWLRLDYLVRKWAYLQTTWLSPLVDIHEVTAERP